MSHISQTPEHDPTEGPQSSVSRLRKQTRNVTPKTTKKPRYFIPGDELEDAQLKGALVEMKVPLPRKITRLKLLGLYTKHVGMITAEPNDPQTYVFQKGIPDPRFYYSVATVSQLQAELLRHGFGTRTRERRSVLVAMYKKEVLKIELEPGTDCTLLNAHATKHTSTSKEEFGREELVPPGIAASVYYKLSVMELRKILEPHPCVVRLLHKQDLVALCDKFKPAFGFTSDTNQTLVEMSTTSNGDTSKPSSDRGHTPCSSSGMDSPTVVKNFKSKSKPSGHMHERVRAKKDKSSITTDLKSQKKLLFRHLEIPKLKKKAVAAPKIQDWLGDLDEPIMEEQEEEEGERNTTKITSAQKEGPVSKSSESNLLTTCTEVPVLPASVAQTAMVEPPSPHILPERSLPLPALGNARNVPDDQSEDTHEANTSNRSGQLEEQETERMSDANGDRLRDETNAKQVDAQQALTGQKVIQDGLGEDDGNIEEVSNDVQGETETEKISQQVEAKLIVRRIWQEIGDSDSEDNAESSDESSESEEDDFKEQRSVVSVSKESTGPPAKKSGENVEGMKTGQADGDEGTVMPSADSREEKAPLVSKECELNGPTNIDSSERSSARCLEEALRPGNSVLSSVFGVLKLLHTGQKSMRKEMATHTASIAEALETTDVATMERFALLDIKLADMYEKQRQSALDIQGVIAALENITTILELGGPSSLAGEGGSRKRAAHRSNEPKLPIGSRLPALIRLHCATLLGITKDNKEFPRPATLGEKRGWLQELASENEEESEEELTRPKEVDQQQIIIKRMLRKYGVRRFAPDLAQGVNSEENKFLWEVAVKILVKLVRCGEYTGVCLEDTPETVIASHLKRHVKDCLHKRFRQQNKWTEEEMATHAKTARATSRLTTLREGRKEIALLITGLEEFVQYIHGCCSDDESQSEDDHETIVQLGRQKKRKVCRTFRLKWRSLRVEKVMTALDNRRVEHLLGSPTKQAGNLGRIRERIQNKESRIGAVIGLPIDFYDIAWLGSLTTLEVSRLDIDITPALDKIMKILGL